MTQLGHEVLLPRCSNGSLTEVGEFSIGSSAKIFEPMQREEFDEAEIHYACGGSRVPRTDGQPRNRLRWEQARSNDRAGALLCWLRKARKGLEGDEQKSGTLGPAAGFPFCAVPASLTKGTVG